MSELASTNSSSPSSVAPTSHRKERGAIAAQACETCRSRKQRCDEQRPKCGTCQRFKLECKYREPQPTKKDKTLVEILDRLKSLEGKIDALSIRNAIPSSVVYNTVPVSADLGAVPANVRTSRQDSIPPSLHLSDPASPAPTVSPSYKYMSAAHKLLAWPAIQQTLESVRQHAPFLNPPAIEQEGPSIWLGVRGTHTPSFMGPSVDGHSSVPARLPGPGNGLSMDLSTPNLSWETAQRLCKHYFDTFNFIYPILDRQVFLSQTLSTVVGDSFSENIASTLAYLVFALGEVAMACNHSDTAAGVYKGRPSGVRGGTLERPPGLAFFNEARKRMGFNLTECSLENVQIFALAALYYQTCFHHSEFWRMSISASLACQALISCNPNEFTSSRADLAKRVFWHCLIQETLLHMELDIPLTGLDKYEDLVGLPTFSTGQFCEEDYIGNQESHYQENFISQIVIRKLSVEFHSALSSAAGTVNPVQSQAINPAEHPPLPSTIKQLAIQLEQWRSLLPEYLRWQDSAGGQTGTGASSMSGDDTAVMPVPQVIFSSTGADMYPSPTQPSILFTSDLDAPQQNLYPYAIDIQIALLRTRYYWCRYLIYRPFVYKALHYPEQISRDDASGAADCLRSTLKWPITMVPTSRNKRVIPCLFAWSQNVLGILVLLHLSQQHNLLRQIRTTLLGEAFDVEAKESIALYLDWLRDLRLADPAAKWCWGIARALYQVDD